ncbi:hypothetical protein HZA96_01380 [Candidatus Woesearchaeota archaeon]|nr:hypothetical protein [Candidatus Woesearchaeota archaeon]
MLDESDCPEKAFSASIYKNTPHVKLLLNQLYTTTHPNEAKANEIYQKLGMTKVSESGEIPFNDGIVKSVRVIVYQYKIN